MLDKEKARQIAVAYANEVIKVLKAEKIIFFGSYVDGNPHENSDIDIAVFVQGLDAEAWYQARITLQELRWNVTFLDVEPHLLEENNDPSGFAHHVAETGEVVYAA